MNSSPKSSLSARLSVCVFLLFAAAAAAPLEPSQKKSAQHAGHGSRPGRVQTGIDVLAAQKFAPLRGKHVGLITNHTGLDARDKTTIALLAHAPGVLLVALFSPEHGLLGQADEKVASSQDPSTGLPIYSLYGDGRRPTDAMLQGIDALVFDVQDAGVRFYTYTSTMAYCLEEAAKRNIAFFVLDRPNPLNGEVIEGPVTDRDKTGWLSYMALPVRYGLTIGELARYFNAENHINCDLHVIAMKNWHRNYFFDSTGIRWIPPSPNLRTTKGAILYPGIEILQSGGLSVGRGTQAPFEEFGAPWLDGEAVAAALNDRHLPGVRFSSEPFIPASGLFAGKRCGGVSIRVTDRAAVRSMRIGMEIAALLHQRYPKDFDVSKLITLVGHDGSIGQLDSGANPEQIVAAWSHDLAAFDATRRKYFLYQ